MANKGTNVILTTYPDGKGTLLSPTKLKVGSWTFEQKMNFLEYVRGFHPFADGCYRNTCSFNVHVDDYVIHSRGFSAPKTFKPIKPKNKNNELIIEIITDEENRTCWPVCPATCPLCIQDGQCTSPLATKYIGKFLFPTKYAKQR